MSAIGSMVAEAGGKRTLAKGHAKGFLQTVKPSGSLVVLVALAACASEPATGDPMAAFRMLDGDHNGEVSASEWKRSADAATAQLPPGPKAENYRCQLMTLFVSLDTDHDGRISSTEWKSGKFEGRPQACP